MRLALNFTGPKDRLLLAQNEVLGSRSFPSSFFVVESHRDDRSSEYVFVQHDTVSFEE